MAAKKQSTRRTGAILLRLNAAEVAAIRRAAGREPVAAFVRRVVMERIERSKARKGD